MARPCKPGVLAWLWVASLGVQAAPLPLDVIGLYVIGATPVVAGSGYQAGDTLALPGGATVSVAKVTAGTGIAEVSVTQPLLHDCLGPGPVTASSTHGSGAQFTLAVLRPTAYGTHLLSRCYQGPAITAEGKALKFLADGSLAPGALARIAVWHDQGGGNNDATQPDATLRPVLSAERRHGNSRAVLFDAHAGAGEWDPANTYLTLPASVTLAANHFTLAVIGAATSAFAPVGFVAVGDIADRNAGLEFAHYSTQPTACDGAGDNAYAAVVPTETPAIIVCSADAQGKTLDMLGTSTTTPGGNATPLAGGSLGLSGGDRSGLVNMSAAIIVPWPLDATTRAALNTSLAQTFGLPAPNGGVIVVLGDSHSDGSGAPFQQGWPQQMIRQLGRDDIQLVNAARYGGRLADAVGLWEQYALPNLAASRSPNKVVILQGGYNDQQSGQSADDILATYRRGAALAHKAGAKVVCVADVIRSAEPRANSTLMVVNAALRAPLDSCDAVIDWASEPAFNRPAGPYPPPLFASDRIHLTAQGQALQARMAAAVIAGLLK
ncbi:SGNH/GDSL hydrolase family protein [Pseudomonas sp. App30]|uniref:SGNH/GDSL hydrolase family protein n=1 Tax=Pseudomonas sp. App30 TaxID=3068990 RepID=UPI003A804EB6